MKARVYKGTNIHDLYKKIKEDLGHNAIILHTRTRERKGVLKLFGKTTYEIIAGSGEFKTVHDYKHHAKEEALARAYDIEQGKFSLKSDTQSLSKGEIANIKNTLEKINQRIAHRNLIGCPESLFEEYLAFVNNKVSPQLAEGLVKKVEKNLGPAALTNKVILKDAIKNTILGLVKCSDNGIALKEGKATTVAFIGPTGVGKTTTISKLAAIYKLRYKKEIGVITCDTYRIAAVAQLEKTIGLMDVPLKKVNTPAEIKRAIAEFKNKELILIDTAGRSHKNKVRMDELRELLAAAQPDETHLVIDLSKDSDTIAGYLEKFAESGFSKIVLTKLDEAEKFGLILDIIANMDKQLSFVTTGQNIPVDIEIADSKRIVNLITGEEHLIEK